MTTILTTNPQEESSYFVTVSFTDENGDAVTPTAVTWALLDEYGAIIEHDQEEVEESDLASSITLILSGDDLAVSASSGRRKRRLLVEATYDSDLGDDLPLRDEIEFMIENLVGLPHAEAEPAE